jgi:hypothetical protein
MILPEIERELSGLMPEEREEILKQIEGLESTKELRKAIRDYKFKLDYPELTEEACRPVPEDEFDKVQVHILVIDEFVDNVDAMNLVAVHPYAKEYLFSHIKKSIGHLARLVES